MLSWRFPTFLTILLLPSCLISSYLEETLHKINGWHQQIIQSKMFGHDGGHDRRYEGGHDGGHDVGHKWGDNIL